MSDALSYLAKARPEAMGHYFAFLKDAGTLLDPKSRALISVITKVYAQTERGLLQYTRRALAEGCAPAEILDALLMAFPALGLSKIVWAVDVLLASELEEFSLENVGVRPDWRRLGAVTDFNDRTATRVECDGHALFVYRDGATFTVYDSHCPHQRTKIPLEALAGASLRCPKHGWTFDVATGACTAVGDRPLTRHKSKVEDETLYAFF
jgi:nitrite reductase/ring-hydroxylating ferredoxin subunit/alkylhydroperoxidase/carboxymuconolactone decarboxylase family protein YurZ